MKQWKIEGDPRFAGFMFVNGTLTYTEPVRVTIAVQVAAGGAER